MPKTPARKDQETAAEATPAATSSAPVSHPTAEPAHRPDGVRVESEDPGVGRFLTEINNYESLWGAENSVPGYQAAKDAAADGTGSTSKVSKLNKKVRQAVGSELEGMVEAGTVSGGEVLDTYQSSHDEGEDFGSPLANRSQLDGCRQGLSTDG